MDTETSLATIAARMVDAVLTYETACRLFDNAAQSTSTFLVEYQRLEFERAVASDRLRDLAKAYLKVRSDPNVQAL